MGRLREGQNLVLCTSQLCTMAFEHRGFCRADQSLPCTTRTQRTPILLRVADEFTAPARLVHAQAVHHQLALNAPVARSQAARDSTPMPGGES